MEPETKQTNHGGASWDLLISIRFYVIFFIFLAPVFNVFFHIGYLPPVDIVILGFSILLILRFVIFEPRANSKLFLKVSLTFLIPVVYIIFININNLLAMSSLSVGTLVYFILVVYFKPFKRLNSWFYSKMLQFGQQKFYKKHYLGIVFIFWLIISPMLILIPYRVYQQEPPSTSGGRNIGVWTSSFYYDIDNPDHLPNATLELLANHSIYVVISIKQKDIGPELEERLNRCRTFGLKVHLSISVMNISYKYVNIWTFEALMPQIEAILSFLNTSNLLGDPVTTLVYDMECLPEALFLIYVNSTIRAKLTEYYAIQDTFLEFNRHVREDYNLSVRICTDYGQGFDRTDWDDDLIVMRGLMHDDAATMSYMVYRRDNLGQNHILDHCRFLKNGETIILNSWKFEGYLCWNDIGCAIEDARLVLGYPGKILHLEIWTLFYFLQSYGLDGFHNFITALGGNWANWSGIKVENAFPYSTFWDLVLFGVSLLDFYGPLFRLMNNAF
jgi:hypothetical protein